MAYSDLPVTRLQPQQEFAEQLVSWTEPKYLPGLVSNWPLVQAAKTSDGALVEYLLKFDVGATVDCMYLAHQHQGRMFYSQDMNGFNFTRRRMAFSKALSKLMELAEQDQADSLYVGSTTIATCLPELLNSNSLPIEKLQPLGTLWIGNKSRIAAHYDVPDNLICVAAGKRRVTLFPPEQVENLYIGPLHHTPAGQAVSMVDFAAPDFSRFPRFKHALEAAITIELEPGDCLFIPSMWWHHIEGQETINMLVNFWWRTTPTYLGRNENALYHALLTIKQLPSEQRKAWKAMYDHYVFADDDSRFDHIPPKHQGPLGDVDEPTMRQFKAWLANNLKH